jgi:hypothetical protein
VCVCVCVSSTSAQGEITIMETVTEYVGHVHPATAAGSSNLIPAPIMVRAKKLGLMLVAAVFVALLGWGGSALFGARWILLSGYGLAGLVAVAGAYMACTAHLANCPYCGKPVGTGADTTLSKSDDRERVECPHCHELLLSHQGELRAFDVNDAKPGQTFSAPLFTGGKWPDECMICGRAVTSRDDITKTSVEFSQLLVGRLAVARGSVSNVPYCNCHKGAISLTRTDDKLRLVFPDVGSRRRYLAANAGNPFAG